MPAQTNHQSSLADAGQHRKLGESLPAVCLELQEVDDAAAHMAGEEEVISLAIGDCHRIEAWELPQIAFRVSEVEKLL